MVEEEARYKEEGDGGREKVEGEVLKEEKRWRRGKVKR